MNKIILFRASAIYCGYKTGFATAFVSENGVIKAVGDFNSLATSYPHAIKVDLRPYFILPGFNDCHCHIMAYGLELEKAQLSNPNIVCMSDLLDALRVWEQTHSDSTWIIGSRYDPLHLHEKRNPSRYDLDAASTDKPIYITQASGHAAVVNSKALELLGIDANASNPNGGIIERDERGEPTGRLFENAMDLAANRIPKPTMKQRVQAVQRASQSMNSMGITSATSAWMRSKEEAIASINAVENHASLRMTLMPYYSLFERDLRQNRLPAISDDLKEWVRYGHVKLFADGAITARTAALRNPYADTDSCGFLLMDELELQHRIEKVHKAGRDVAVHAIGDRAVELTADIIMQLNQTLPRSNANHRIEHCMITDEALLEKVKQCGARIAMQPQFINYFGDSYIKALGMERAQRINPYRSVLRKGIPMAFSSDLPVVSGNPLCGIASAIKRLTPSGIQLSLEESLSAQEAVDCYTYWAGIVGGNAHKAGLLSPGYRADFAVLSHHILTDHFEEWDSVSVLAAYTNGDCVYSRL